MSKQDENSFYTSSSFQVGKGEVRNEWSGNSDTE